MCVDTRDRLTSRAEANSLLGSRKKKSYCRLPTQDKIDQFLPPPSVSANRCRNHGRLIYQNIMSAFTYTTMMIIGWWLVVCKNNLDKCLHSNNLNKIVTAQFSIGVGALIYNMVFSFYRFSHEDISCKQVRAMHATLLVYERKRIENKPTTEQIGKVVSQINLYAKHHRECRLSCSSKSPPHSFSDLGHKLSIFIINFLEGLLTNFLMRSTTLMAYNDISGQYTDAFPTSWTWWAFLIPPSVLFAAFKTYYENITQSKVNSQWYLNDTLREACFIFKENDPDGVGKINSALESYPALFSPKDFDIMLKEGEGFQP